MGDDRASAMSIAPTNVNRTYSLGATSLAIFTFTMIFLYPRYVSGVSRTFPRVRSKPRTWPDLAGDADEA